MTITRKHFLGAAAGASVLLLLQGCGGGDYDDPPGGQACGAGAGAIAGNHGHLLAIPRADLDATSARTYAIQGSANHAHSVTFTVAQLGDLKAGRSVTVTSTTDSAHSHAVTASCA